MTQRIKKKALCLNEAVRSSLALATSFPAAALIGFGSISTVYAGPTGAIVVDGQGTISTPNTTTTVIDQASQRLELNWSTFNVGANESVQFHQPSASAIALNRILDQNPSQIFGSIEANGQIILANPNGMLFGHSAQLNVGSLVASSLDVIGFDAASGRYTFGASRAEPGAVLNEGRITAAPGGSVTLLGGQVSNTGSIIADFGTVNLASGRAATLDLAGDGLLRLEVGADLLSNGSGASAAVENSGTVQANGGRVLLTARALDGVFSNLVNNSGLVQANRIENNGGAIRLLGTGGTVRSSGTLDASAGDALSSGGTVEVLGEHVGLFGNAVVDVSGATDGGTALIGGDYQGSNPDVLNAARTYVGANAVIDADAGAVGDGGKVIVWADDTTRFHGSITARGGTASGDGGFAEVSGKESLVFRGDARLSATAGRAGELLLDPRNITVADGGVGDLDGATDDDSDADTYAFAEDASDDVTIAPGTITNILGGGTTVTLQAHNDLTVTDAIDASGSATPGGGLIFQAGDDIRINADVLTNSGVIQFTAGDLGATPTGDEGDEAPSGELIVAAGVTLSAGNAAVNLTSTGDMELLGTVIGSVITADSGGDLTVGTMNAGTAAVDLIAAGSIVDDGDDTTRVNAGALTLTAGVAIGAAGGSGQIDTAVDALTATANAGGVFIGEADGLTLTNVSAAGVGSDVNVTSTTGDIVVNAVAATNAVTLTATAGAITDDGDNATRIEAAALTLNAGTAIGATGANEQIDTDVTSLSAAAGAGGVYIGELNGLAETNIGAAGAGNDVEVTSTTGNIVVNTVTANAVMLTATAGAITDDGDNATRIEAGALTLNAGTAIGAVGATGRIDTDVTSLNATAGAGGVYIGELNGLTLTNVSAGGAGSDVSVTSAAGDIIVDTVAATDAVTLTATVGSITDDDDNTTRISAETLALNAGTAIGATGANEQIDTDVISLSATAGAGGVYIGELNGLTLTNVSAGGAGSDIDVTSTTGNIVVDTVTAADEVKLTATAGAITDDGNNATRISAGTLTLSAGTAIGATGATGQIDTNVTSLTATAAAGGVYVGELNGLTLTNISAGGAGSDIDVTSTTGDIVVNTVTAADDVTLTATDGAITDDGNNATRIDADALTLSAGTSIGAVGATGQIDTDVASLSATAGAGDVHVGEADGLTLTNVSAAGAGSDVNVTSTTGNIVVNTVTATNAVTLTATAGAITDDSNNATRIEAGALTLNAGTAIGVAGANGQIDTDVTSLSATAGAGGVYIGELNGLTLTNVSAAGAGNDVEVTSTTGNIVVNTVTAADEVTLAATGGAITDDGNNATRINSETLALSAGTAIGSTGASGQIDTNVASLTATAAAGGVYIGEANGLTLTSVSAAGAGNDVEVTNTTGDIIVNTVTAADDVALTATAGAITDDGNNATRIDADALTLSAGTSIGAVGARLNTNVGSLNATSTNGGIFVTEANGLSLTANAAGGATADVNVTSTTGDIVVGAVSAANAITLTSSAGALSDDGNDATVINGVASVSLSAATNVGTVVDFAATNDADVGSSIDVQTNGALNVAVASNTGEINLNLSGAPTLGVGAITLGSGSNRAGEVVLQSAGDLNVAGLAPGALNIGSGNTTAVGLRSGGTLTLPAGGGFTDQPADRLLVRGATDVIDNDASPREFAIGAAALDFRSGGAGGNTTLATTVDRLDARIDNGSLIVNETNGVTLGSISAAGDITLAAGGAIADDNDDLTRISGNAIALSGSAVGSAGNELDTQAASIVAAASAGGVYVREVDALALTASATGGAVDVQTTNGALTVAAASGEGITFSAGGAGSGISLNGAVNAGGGDVVLTAGTTANRGAIAGGGLISGDALTAVGSAVGTSATRLNTNVTSLTATSTNGGIFVSEANGLNLTADAVGALDVQTASGAITVHSASGNDITLAAGGAGSGLVLNGDVDAGAGDIALTAGGAITGNGLVRGDALTAAAAAIGTSGTRLNTNVNSITATSTNGGLFITEAGALNLTVSATGGVADVRTMNGALTVASASGTGVTLNAGGAGSGITVNGAVNAAAGSVVLTAGTAANRGVLSGSGLISGDGMTAVASAIGTSSASLNTAVNSLDATSTNGGIFVAEANALNLSADATGGPVDVRTTNGAVTVAAASGNGITLSAGGAGSGISLNGVVNAGSGDVTLTAGTAANRGAITGGAGHAISGDALILIGSAIGASDARLNTTVAALDATSADGSTFVTDANDLTLAANATGVVDVRTLSGSLTVDSISGSGATLIAGGGGSGITLNTSVDVGAGDVTLTAGSAADRGAIVVGTGVEIDAGSLTATAASIGSSTARLRTNVASLNATSANGGIFIAEANALDLTANASGGTVDVQTTDGAITVASISGDGVTLTAGGVSSGVTLNGAVNAGAGDVTLSAGGAISGSGLISGNALSIAGATIGSSSARLNTNVATLSANASSGGVHIAEQNGLTLANVSAASDISVNTATGDLIVNEVSASNAVALTAAGAILDDGDDTTLISGDSLTLVAQSIGAPSTLSGTVLDSSLRLDTHVRALNATASAGGIFIDEADGLQSVNVHAAGGASGDIELLTRAGDLNLQGVSATDTLLLVAGRDILALGTNPIVASRAELRAGTTDPAGGQIGSLASPLNLQLDAGNSLRLFVPQTIDPEDPDRGPATLPSAGVATTIDFFATPNLSAAMAGFGQFQGLGEEQFTSPAESLLRTLQNQTGTIQTGLDVDWASFDQDVSLFGILEPAVCLPGDQRDEETSTPEC